MAHEDPKPAFDRLFDWAIGAALGIIGLLMIGGGVTLSAAMDRATITDLVREGTIESGTLSEAELIDATLAAGVWGGYGLIATGLLLVAVAIAVVVVHGRTRERGEATPGWILAVAGSLVASLLSFIPFSYAAGGGLAGYLSRGTRRRGLGLGALTGLFAVVPVYVLMGFLLIGLASALPAGELGLVLGIVVVAVLFATVWTIGLSAVGGYVGVWIREQ